MILLNAIREEVISVLNNRLEGIKYIHNGRATFTDTSEQLPAIAVYIDDAEFSPETVCHSDCLADLKIGIYLPLEASEAELDEVAKAIGMLIGTAQLNTVDECELSKYSYDYDPNDSAWVTATLNYRISFFI
ncbi:phage tail protein [Pasteurellaceae bacterium Macca]|nr:phage tail protein [Pasteurellaceae bacterium Macca]MCK3657077.1 phage tail protein [Pasteurellaceae bacterium Macca]